MVWTVIVFVVAAFLLKFFYDVSKQRSQVAKQGGMEIKYRRLIEILLSGDERSKVFDRSQDALILGVSTPSAINLFTLTHSFGNLLVDWKFKSPVLGEHKLHWKFPEYLDQEKMAERISHECGAYQKNVMTAFGLED